MAVKTIDLDKCIGCGTCVETCPMDVFRLDICPTSSGYDSPCRMTCPLGVNQKEYHNLLKLDLVDEAAKALAKYHPMPVITGRICPHTCESECARKHVDEAVNINGLEQYLGDALLEGGEIPALSDNGQKVAVIGAGPGGLSAAYFLRKAGYQVTVFDKEKKPGGVLRTAIPEFRLPEAVLDGQIAYYEKMGIAFVQNVTVGKDISVDQLKSQGFEACIAATGASKPFRLNVLGSDAQGITTAMEYLQAVKSKELTKQKGVVAIIGGGSVALDAARSAIRLGAEQVHLICLEVLDAGHKDSMLAPAQEIQDAIEEGVIIHPSRSVHHFEVENGKVTGLQCVECLAVRNDEGRFCPQYCHDVIPGILAVDTVVSAIGQSADGDLVPQGFAVNQRGYIVADSETNQVEAQLFAAGDAVTGPSTVVKALASGKRAAQMVDNYFQGKPLKAKDALTTREVAPESYEKLFTMPRNNRCSMPACQGKSCFKETTEGFDWHTAHMESQRCLTCGSKSTITYVADCQACRLCADYCPTGAIQVGPGHIPNILHAWDVHNLKL